MYMTGKCGELFAHCTAILSGKEHIELSSMTHTSSLSHDLRNVRRYPLYLEAAGSASSKKMSITLISTPKLHQQQKTDNRIVCRVVP